MYSIRYSEEYYDGRRTQRYEIKNLTHRQMLTTMSFLKQTIPGTLIRYVVYDENNQIIKSGEFKPPTV